MSRWTTCTATQTRPRALAPHLQSLAQLASTASRRNIPGRVWIDSFCVKVNVNIVGLENQLYFLCPNFFFSFADHFGVFVVNIKQHLTLRKS